MAATRALLERDEELATIGLALDGAGVGEGGLLTIEGEAGAGKTSLLDAAAGLAEEKGMLVLRARGGEYERDFPYSVIRQLFEPLLADRARRAELLSGTAAIAAPVFEPRNGAEDGDAFGLQHALYWLLADLASAAPTALLVDDAQWADVASLRALLYAARRLDALPALLVVTVRTGERGEHAGPLGELRREPAARSITPRPLSAGAAAAMISAGSGQGATPSLAEACRKATAGNPLLLVELLRSLDADGAGPGIEDPEQLARLVARGVSGSILARLERLGESSIEVARAVAILEPNAELRRIAALAELDHAAATEACERLISAHLLFDSRPLGFVHPLVRAAVLSDIPVPRRAASHARAARLLDDDGAEPDSVAAHLLLAEPANDPWVVENLRASAEAALGRGGPETAVRYLRRALREPPPKGERSQVSQELGAALLRASDPEGIEVLRAVRAGLADTTRRAEIAFELGNSLSIRAGNEEAAAVLEESLAEVSDSTGPLGLFLRGFLLLQVVWGLERMPPGALPGPEESIPNDSMEGRGLLQFAAILHAFGFGTVEQGRQLAERVLAAESVAEDAAVGTAPQGLALALTVADQGERCEALLEVGIEAGKRRGVALSLYGGHGARSLCRLFDGDLREAQADAEVAVPFLHEIGIQAPTATYLGAAVRAHVARGELEQANALLDRYWRGRKPLPGSAGAMLLCARGTLREAEGRHAEARHDYLAAAERGDWIPRPNPEPFPWRIGLARCEAALGNGEEAERIAEGAVAVAREAGGARGIGISLHAHGVVCRGDGAIELLRQAIEALGGTRARLQHATALVDLGAALRRANHRKEAREPLREGLDLAHRCGAAPLEERARAELAATGARPRQAVFSGVDSLTPSELRVARLAAEGMTNREIAQSLFVTAKTVETHLRHVYQKLDVTRPGLAEALDAGSTAL